MSNRNHGNRFTSISSPIPGAQAFKFRSCTIILDRASNMWHLSISHPRRLPTWEELREARYALIPNGVTVAMLLPPKDQYVNIHDNCFHLFEIHPDEFRENTDFLRSVGIA